MNPRTAAHHDEYQFLVIGAGQGGALARMLATSGHRTALVERAEVGGTCVNVGCTPTKTLAYSARVAHLARRSREYGVNAGPVTVDMAAVRERARDMVRRFRDGVEQNLTETHRLDFVRGSARFTGPQCVEVALHSGGRRAFEAGTVIIAAGTRSAVPRIPGLEDVPHLDSSSILDLDEVPRHLLVLGGGYIAVEFGQMFRRFGAEVAIIERGGQLLPREDADVADALTDILREDGLRVYTNSEATGVRWTEDGITININTGDSDRTLHGSHLLVATGRKPNTDSLNLEAAGVEVDEHGYVQVNDQLETNVAGVYALGDIKGGPAFTHIAYDDARLLCANLSDGRHDSIRGRQVPYTVFTDPQLGRVGLTEKEAREQGLRFRVAKLTMDQTARGEETGETRGLWKILVEDGTHRILGGAFLSLDGGEIMAVLQVAMLGNLPYTALRDGIFAHPTLAESLNNIFLALDRQGKRGRQE